MAITRIKNSSIRSNGPKYDNALAGLPYRPIIGTATDGGNGTTVSVAFTANNVAGAGVTYTALSNPGNFTGTGVASPVTVGGLTAGTAYTFQVKAGNSLGDSAYSASSNSVTPVAPASFESIATATGTGSSTTITFSSIPSGFKHLQIKGVMQESGTGTTSGVRIRFNSDTGANYAEHLLLGNGSSVSASATTSTTSISLGQAVRSTSYADTTAVFIADILDAFSTTKNKTLRSFYGFDLNGSGVSGLWSGLWMSTSAINSISIFTTNNLTTKTTVSLYGIKESA